LTTLLDFSDTGVLDVFVDEVQVALREQSIGRKGIMPGVIWPVLFQAYVRMIWCGAMCSRII
jgi:poly(3-hydroxyalkanoate) synthetase